MILTFHKVDSFSKSYWWITNDDFYRILDELSDKKFVYLDDYDPKNENQIVITFDGPYSCILNFAARELAKRKIPFEVYVIGDYIGKNNSFDSVEPLTNFCSMQELQELVSLGGRLQWHTKTHQLGDNPVKETIIEEFTPPNYLKELFPDHFTHFAYPHGNASPEMIDFASNIFKSAASVDDGDSNNLFFLPRVTVGPNHSFKKNNLTTVIVNFNYGHFLTECVESVRRQTLKPDKILIVDDCSSDGSKEIIRLISRDEKIILNDRNLGIVDNFNNILNQIDTEFVMFLGADNYIHPNATELIFRVFQENPEVDIVYFDMAIVGPLGESLANKTGARKIGKSIRDNLYVFIWEFPDFNENSKSNLGNSNFINGSAAYRVSAAKKVGGYKKQYPEDHNLWVRMVEDGSKAIRIPFPILYYRQHSISQANTALSSKLENDHLRSVNFELVQKYEDLVQKYEDLVQQYGSISNHNEYLLSRHRLIINSTSWKITKPFRFLKRKLKF